MALKRIALISYFYTGILPYGGSVYIDRLLNALSQDKQSSVDFYCPLPNYKFKKVKNTNYIFIPMVNLPFFRYLSFCYRTARIIKKRDKYDLIQSNTGGGIFLKNIDIEVYNHYEPFSLKNIPQWLSYQIIRLCLHRARHIIAVSDQSFKELIKFEGIPKKRITLVRHAIDLSRFDIIKEKGIKSDDYKSQPDQKILLFIGYLIQRKQPLLALETLKFILDNKISARLLIIGLGPLEKLLKVKAERLGLSDYVVFLEKVENVAPYYRIADLLLVPSEREGFGYPFLEAPACGAFFVSFNTGIASFMAKAGFGVIVKTKNEFKQKALDILKNNRINDKIGYEFVKNSFSLEKWVEKMKVFYNKFLFNRDK